MIGLAHSASLGCRWREKIEKFYHTELNLPTPQISASGCCSEENYTKLKSYKFFGFPDDRKPMKATDRETMADDTVVPAS